MNDTKFHHILFLIEVTTISCNTTHGKSHRAFNDQCSPSHRNQSIDLQCKSIDWFLYDGEHWSLLGKQRNRKVITFSKGNRHTAVRYNYLLIVKDGTLALFMKNKNKERLTAHSFLHSLKPA